MKLKFKALAVASAMVMAGHASAALSDTFVTNGTLFLTVWDVNTNKSYVRDLGVDLDSFQANAQGGTKTPDAGLTQVFGNLANSTLFTTQFGASSSANIRWTVVGVDGIEGEGAGNGSRFVSAAAGAVDTVNSGVRGLASMTSNFAGELIANSGVDFTGAPAEYGSTGTLSTDGGGAAWGQLIPFQGLDELIVSGFGTAQFWYGATTNDDLSGDPLPAFFQRFGNSTEFASLSLGADGVLTYDLTPAAVAAVPLPAAAWMLGAGLMGIGGFVRRRKAAALAA